MNYETVIGLEVHVQLKTQSKIFCGCSTEFGAPPNTQTCPICLGFPGVLPVLNRRVLELALRVGLALDCKITPRMKFDRKNYFYPDLPKNFQISQFDLPMATAGRLDVPMPDKMLTVRIRRVHLEEDAGKLIHPSDGKSSLVDFNRTGVALIEVVSEPDLASPLEAYAYLEQLKAILEYLGVSDCDMEKGSLRCDANISLRPIPPPDLSAGGGLTYGTCQSQPSVDKSGGGTKGQAEFGVKAEIKNMNTFKGVRTALAYEVERQAKALDQGKRLTQETRLWDSQASVTRPMRSKEEAHDYRYFPEPDLVPFDMTDAILKEIRKNLPELPRQRKERMTQQYGLSEYDAGVLTREKAIADYFEACVKLYSKPKVVANWIIHELMGHLRERNIGIHELGCKSEWFVEMLGFIDRETISGKMAKELLAQMIETRQSPSQIMTKLEFVQISDDSLIQKVIDQVIRENPKSAEDYSNGKSNAIMFLVGQVMKLTKGKANPAKAQELLRESLEFKKRGGVS